jgi:hypothetical protein
MSAHSSPAVHKPNPQVATPHPDPGTDPSFDARWAAWIERGRQHDLAVKRKLRIALLCAAALGLLVAIFLGVAAGAR